MRPKDISPHKMVLGFGVIIFFSILGMILTGFYDFGVEDQEAKARNIQECAEGDISKC